MRMRRLAAHLLCLTTFLACVDAPTAIDASRKAPASGEVSAVIVTSTSYLTALAKGARFAESSYMACILSYYAQGFSLRDIREICSVQLTWQAKYGWGPAAATVDAAMAGFKTPAADPSAVAMSCGSINPTVAQNRSLERGMMQTSDPMMGAKNWGEYTWGAPRGGCDLSYCYKGLTEKESRDAKKAAVDEARAAEAAAQQAEQDAKDDPKDKAKQEEAEKKRAEAEKAKEKAAADPNKKAKPAPAPAPLPTSNTGGADLSTCAAVVQVARDLIAECNRTDWQRSECQQLHAKVNRCPDPRLIFVDPESGYACAPKVDPTLIIDAWRQQCEQLVRPGPDGGSPCNKPVVSDGGHVVEGNPDDVCRSPIARTDPENDGCIASLEIDTFGQTDIDGLIVWGQGVFGGPIVVLPKPPLPLPRPR